MKRWLEIALVCGLLIGSASASGEQGDSGRQLYYRGLALEKAGKLDQAQAIFSRLAEQLPEDAFADDALLESARLAEEEQSDPARAKEIYERLLKRYPDSRLSRRARARAEYLERHLGGDAELLAGFQNLLRRGHGLDVSEADAQMRELVESHPDFGLAPQGLLWLASRWAMEGETNKAEAIYRQILEQYPSAPAAPASLLALAESARARGDLEGAERAYARLASLGDPAWLKSAEEGRLRLDQLGRRRQWTWLGVGIWSLVALCLWLALWVAWRRGADLSWRPPVEVLLFLLIMSGLLWLTHGRAEQAHRALWWLGGASLLLLLPNAWLLRVLRPKAWLMGVWCLGLLLGWAAAVLAGVGLAGMLGQVAHTFTHGMG